MHDAGITISNSDLKRLLACANADAALLYLYLAAGNDPAQAQTALVKFSSALNEGLGQMETASEKAQDISESINKCITIIDSEEK